MRTARKRLFVLVISQLVLWIAIPRDCGAHPDSDFPYDLSFSGEYTLNGNPLGDEDWVYSLRGSYRLFGGDLALEALLGYGEPSTDLVPNASEDAELLLLDLSVVWYANHRLLYRGYGKAWSPDRKLKPELYLFGGPGWASLRVKDVVQDPGLPPQLTDASDDFFTLNFGAGLKIHWFEGEHGHTSNWHLRPELRARYFGGGEDTVDWGVGLVVGYSFGRRPSCRALELEIVQACGEVAAPAYDREQGAERSDPHHSYRTPREHRSYLEELKARALVAAPRCKYLRDRVDERIKELNAALKQLSGGAESTN